MEEELERLRKAVWSKRLYDSMCCNFCNGDLNHRVPLERDGEPPTDCAKNCVVRPMLAYQPKNKVWCSGCEGTGFVVKGEHDVFCTDCNGLGYSLLTEEDLAMIVRLRQNDRIIDLPLKDAADAIGMEPGLVCYNIVNCKQTLNDKGCIDIPET